MLTPVYARRIVIFSSLFAAVCAGYVAGLRGLPSLTPATESSGSISNPEDVTPHYTGDDITVALQPAPTIAQSRDAQVGALLAMSEAKTWEFVMRPAPHVKWVRFSLEMREAGKTPYTLCGGSISVNYSDAQKGKTKNVVVSFMPSDGTLSSAKTLRTRIDVQGAAVSQESVNVFRGYYTLGTIDSTAYIPAKPEKVDAPKPAEVKLTEVTLGRDSKLQRKKILYMTFQAERSR